MPARQKTDEVDFEHLVDILQEYAMKCGLEQAFDFGEYDKLQKQQAVNGRELATHKDFIASLRGVSDKLLLKYSDLKSAYTRLVKKFPQILSRFQIAEKDYKPGHFATTTTTLLTHTRRLRDEQKFREACRGLPNFYISKLQELSGLVMEGEPNMVPVAKAGKPGKVQEALTPQGKKKKPSSSKSCGWREIMDMEIPATQSASEAEPALEEMATEEEGLGALGESPVPPRKRDLKAKIKKAVSAKSPMKKPAGMLQKQAAVLKKPAARPGQAWFLMPYNEKKKWAVAVREKGGHQLLAVSKFGNREKIWLLLGSFSGCWRMVNPLLRCWRPSRTFESRWGSIGKLEGWKAKRDSSWHH